MIIIRPNYSYIRLIEIFWAIIKPKSNKQVKIVETSDIFLKFSWKNAAQDRHWYCARIYGWSLAKCSKTQLLSGNICLLTFIPWSSIILSGTDFMWAARHMLPKILWIVTINFLQNIMKISNSHNSSFYFPPGTWT